MVKTPPHASATGSDSEGGNEGVKESREVREEEKRKGGSRLRKGHDVK